MSDLHNIEAEQGLLGAVLLTNEMADKCTGLESQHFYEPVHGRIWKIALEMIEAGRLCSPVTIKPFLADDKALADLGGSQYVANLAANAISLGAAKDYAQTIIELSARRDLDQALEEARTKCRAFEPVESVAERVDEALMAVRLEVDNRPTTVPFARAATVALEQANEAFQRGTGVDIATGIPEIDEPLGGLSADEFIIIAGRPSMGKSALAIEIIRRQAMAGLWTVYWSGEMSPQSVAARVLSAESRDISYHNASRGRMSEDEFRRLLETGQALEHLPMRLIDHRLRTLPQVCREIRRNVRRIWDNGGEIGSVVVDYIQQLRGSGRRYDEVTEASSTLKALQSELEVPIIGVSQLSRAVEQRENKRPMLSDLRESGQLEQDGQKILACYRNDYYLERAVTNAKESEKSALIQALADARGRMEIIILKNRNGPLSTAHVGYDAPHNRIYTLGSSNEQPDFEF